MRKQARLIRPPSPLGARLLRTFRCSTIRTGRGSTVKAAIDLSLDHKGRHRRHQRMRKQARLFWLLI